MDFSLPDDLTELKERTERFVREEILPYESDTRQTAHGPTEELRRELVGLGRQAGLLSPHVGRGLGRARARPSRQGGGLRGRRLLAARAGSAQLLRSRRGQHAPPRSRSPTTPEGGVAAAARRRRDPLVLHDDRAAPGRRRRPLDAADDRAPRRQRRRFRHRRQEMADHRRGRRRFAIVMAQERQRCAGAGRRHDVPRRR